MPRWKPDDYGLGYADGQQDADLGVDHQWESLGSDTYDGEDVYWVGYHDGRWNWPDKRTESAWMSSFFGNPASKTTNPSAGT